MAADPEAFLPAWHRIVRERDFEALAGVLAPDVAIGAPPYWTKLNGEKLVHHLLGLVIETIDGFTYHREWRNGVELALEFTGRVGDMDLQGIDLITLDASNRIQNLDVLMRPVNAVIALQKAIAPRMAAFLSEAQAAG